MRAALPELLVGRAFRLSVAAGCPSIGARRRRLRVSRRRRRRQPDAFALVHEPVALEFAGRAPRRTGAGTSRSRSANRDGRRSARSPVAPDRGPHALYGGLQHRLGSCPDAPHERDASEPLPQFGQLDGHCMLNYSVHSV